MNRPPAQGALRPGQIGIGVAKHVIDQLALESHASIRRIDNENRRWNLQQHRAYPPLAGAHRRLRPLKLADIAPCHDRPGHAAASVADRPGVAQESQKAAVVTPDDQRFVQRNFAGACGAGQGAISGIQGNVAPWQIDFPNIGLAQRALSGQLVALRPTSAIPRALTRST